MHALSDDLRSILEAGCWAPSGDNMQPWSITLIDDHNFALSVRHEPENVYLKLPFPHLFALGMFLQNAALAAAEKGYALTWRYEDDRALVNLAPCSGQLPVSDLTVQIKLRSVNRFAYGFKPLPAEIKESLARELGDGFRVDFIDGVKRKFSLALFLQKVASFRLHLPEAYEVHRDIIDWRSADSPDRIPCGALGANRLTTKIMKWALGSFARNQAMMAIPGAALPVTLEMDFVPAMMSNAHFVISANTSTPLELQDYIKAGSAVQRFWLRATAFKLTVQPWYTPAMFTRYVEAKIAFTACKKSQLRAEAMAAQFDMLISKPLNTSAARVIFSGRIGYPRVRRLPRSVRKPLSAFISND